MSRLQEWALRLNRRQTRALVFGIALTLFTGLYPCWYFIRFNEVGGSTREFAGFHFMADPPVYPSEIFRAEAHVNWLVFFIIELVCIGITAVFISVLRDQNNEAGSTYGHYR